MQRVWRRNWEKNKKYQQALVKKGVGPLVAVGLVFSMMTGAYANPTGGVITTGTGSIVNDGKVVTINQDTDKLGINWNTFSIGLGETVNFVQPGSQSIALNRVIGSEASNIYGTLTANGKVFLINPNGVLFAPGASVNVGSLVASTSNISDEDFQKGNYTFVGGQGGSVINGGSIIATAGNVELLGSVVSNQGVIAATTISTDSNNGVVRLVGKSVNLSAGSKINAGHSVVLRADADGTGVGTVTVAADTVVAPKTTIYYNPIAYNDKNTKSDSVTNPYSKLLPDTDVTAYMLVNTVTDLQNINNNIYGTYALNNDLNMENVNFAPIGNVTGAFSGIFNGDNHTISNLTINSNAANVGLFASTNNAVIHDVNLADVDITATAGRNATYTGALVGKAVKSTISNVSVSGKVQGNNDYIAGIAGRSQSSTITNAYNSANMTTFDNSGRLRHAAGIVGLNDNGSILDASVNTGKITNNNSEGYLAGLVAFNYNGSTVQNSLNTGIVTGGASSSSYVGGLVASNWGDTVATGSFILNSANKGIVEGGITSNIGGVAGGQKNSSVISSTNEGLISGGDWRIGGIVGINNDNSLIDSSSNYGKVSSNGKADIGGLVGYQTNSTIINSENHGVVSGGVDSNTGGLAGYQLGGGIINGKNFANIIGGINGNTGGLVGYQVNGTVNNAKNYGYVTDTLGDSSSSSDTKVRLDSAYEPTDTKKNVGGIVGKSVGGIIENSTNNGSVIAANTFSNAGGIVGWADGATVMSSSNGAWVSGADSSNVGGIAGYNGNGSVLSLVTNVGIIGQLSNNANGQNNSNVGGIVGWNSGSTVDDASNTGAVNAGNAWYAGGIAGNNSESHVAGLGVASSISNARNTGAVTVFSNRSYVGGISGVNYNSKVVVTENSGTIINHGDESYTGGIVGTNWQGSLIDQSVNSGVVTAAGQTVNVGGIAAGNGNDAGANDYIRSSYITNTLNTGTVTGGSGAYSVTGGILGFNRGGSVENSLNAGLVIGASGSKNNGALVGKLMSTTDEIINSYYNINTSGALSPFGNAITSGYGLTSEQVKDINSFVGWDFDTIWSMGSMMPNLNSVIQM